MQNKWVVGTEPRGICVTQTLEVALTFLIPAWGRNKYSLNHSSLNDSKVKSTLSLLYSAWAQKIHRMVWVGMHFKDHLVPILLIRTGTRSPRMLRAHPNLSLSLPALQFAAISSLDNLAGTSQTHFPLTPQPREQGWGCEGGWDINSGYFQLLKSPVNGC